MKRRKVIERLTEDAKAILPERHRNEYGRGLQNIPPAGTVTNLPDDLPLGMRPQAWQGVFSGAEMARAWLEGYHAATRHAINLLGGES